MKFLTRKKAANYLTEERGIPTTWKSLQKLASTGGGPQYRLFGQRALYTREDLDAWIDEKLTPARRSTSEVQGRAA
jgi:hypothetical protein